MKIFCTTTFLDGTDRFEKGDVRTVSDERGAYFLSNGWATRADGDVAEASEGLADGATLNVHSSTLGQEVRHG